MFCSEMGEFMPARWNATWWGYWVVCITVEEVAEKGEEDEFIRFFQYKEDGSIWVKTTLLRLSSPPDKHVSDHLFHNITEYTEVRQDWSVVPRGWGAYHSFTLLHVQGNELTICLEKKTDKLEIMLAHGARATRFLEDAGWFRVLRARASSQCKNFRAMGNFGSRKSKINQYVEYREEGGTSPSGALPTQSDWESRMPTKSSAHRVLVIIIAQITEERYMDRDGHRKYEDTTVPKGGKGHGEHQDSWAMDASEPVEDMVTLVQSQINYTRKAEARVRNLEAARVKKENMWNKYFDELKKAYVRELSRYQKAMNKIDQDLAAATAARDEARRALQQFDFRKIGEEDSQATEELALEWHALTKSWAKEQEAASEQTAMHRPHLPFPGMTPGMGLAPAPMMGMPNGAMMTPDAAARLFLATIAGQPMMSDQASVPATAAMPPSSAEERTDKPAEPEQGHVPAGAGTAPPYVPSPSARTCDAPSPPVKPPQRSRQRLPIKGQPLHPVHTQVPVPATLADKLAAKRSVMKPFCKTEEGAVASAGPLEARPDSAGPPEQQDIEVIMSGGDTDDEPPPIPKGPSLDGLG
ncbi:hypothetical protein AK812_SmicGene37770 [Symbiodinium microadriaticum]|uniref:Uncharacterized protein n=1 Tax=Symbiodinium microadriaticum TaxID=2951 RepID=A0A1Q9CFD9_SYMMI|nr:hypothetical protein AK812_SmicGene37770 [Symbiodinium microadriaticum]